VSGVSKHYLRDLGIEELKKSEIQELDRQDTINLQIPKFAIPKLCTLIPVQIGSLAEPFSSDLA
jgi:hypothetical protein